jgi:hypothetical protein
MSTKNFSTSNTSQGATSQVATTVSRTLSAVAFDHTFTAHILVAVIAAVLRSAVFGADIVLTMPTAVHFADAALVKVVLLWRFRGRYDSWSWWFLPTDQ